MLFVCLWVALLAYTVESWWVLGLSITQAVTILGHMCYKLGHDEAKKK